MHVHVTVEDIRYHTCTSQSFSEIILSEDLFWGPIFLGKEPIYLKLQKENMPQGTKERKAFY